MLWAALSSFLFYHRLSWSLVSTNAPPTGCHVVKVQHFSNHCHFVIERSTIKHSYWCLMLPRDYRLVALFTRERKQSGSMDGKQKCMHKELKCLFLAWYDGEHEIIFCILFLHFKVGAHGLIYTVQRPRNSPLDVGIQIQRYSPLKTYIFKSSNSHFWTCLINEFEVWSIVRNMY
jgi:hypothetical protein